MNIETATRLIHILELRLESTERAIESLIRMSKKFEDVMNENTTHMLIAWRMEVVIINNDVCKLENIIQTTTPKKANLTVIK